MGTIESGSETDGPEWDAQSMDLRKAWEEQAARWLDWARTPKHDSFWAYSGSFFNDIVPDGLGLVLDLGCGEGRVSRLLAESAQQVIAIDSSPTLIREARAADLQSVYLVGDASRLPFESESFRTVVAYNSLMDLNDVPAGVAEATRVLKTGGLFCICILHPVGDVGRFPNEDEDAPFMIDDYYKSQLYEQCHERDGLQMTFNSWHHPLSHYTDSLQASGLLIDRIKEPLPDYEALGRRQWPRAERIPMFMFIRAVKP
jgi:SAM-dependent methyltransferase